MANSKLFLGDINIRSFKLGTRDVKLYLGNNAVYPTSTSLDDAVVTCGSATYNAQTQIAEEITVVLSGNTLTKDVDYNVTQNSGGINVGDYTVEVTGINNYEGTASGTFTINKVTPTVTAPTAVTGLVYNATAQALANAGSTNFGTLKYSLDGSTYTTSIPSGTNATSYTIYYKVVGDSNVNDVAAASINNSISKVTPTVVLPTAKVLTYNGSAQELVNAGSTDYGTLQYRAGSDSWSTSIPTRTRGGSYTVEYRVVGDSNINDVAAQSVNCSINEKQVTATVTLSQTAYTYNGTAFEPSVTVKDGGTVIDPSEYTATYSNNVNAGTGTVTISDNTGGDYEVIGSATFTINKAPGSVTTAPTAKSLTYNGSAQALVNAGSGTGTMMYKLDNGSWDSSIPTATNATSYTVYYKAAESANYNESTSGSVACSIGKADQSAPTATGASVTYGNTATATASGGGGQGSLEWSNGNTLTGNVGSKTTKARWAGNSNYNASSYSNEVTLSITKADQSAPTATGATTTYSTTATATASGGGGQGSIEWSNGNTQISVGSKTTKARWSGNSNYNASPYSNEVTLTMNKATGSVSTAPVNNNYTYNGTARAVASAGSGTGTMYYRLGTSGSFSTTMPTMTNASSSTLYYYAAESTNYTQSTTSSITVSVQKANSSLSFSVTNLTVEVGGTKTNAVTVNAGDGTVTYSSNNTAVVTVNNSGVVTGVGVGSTTVKANISSTSNYNSASTSYSVSCALVLTAKFNVTDTSNPTPIGYEEYTSGFSAIEIDGVVQPSVVSAYTFSTTGKHTVKYYLTNTSIGNYAFASCSSLTSIDIPDGLTTIGNGTFQSCTSLTSIVIPNSVTSIGSQAFYSCSGMTSCTIGSGVTSISDYTFYYCTSLTSIDIPSGVTSIGGAAFADCTSLTSIVIPSGVTSISYGAFRECSSLTSIVIPSGVTSIGGSAFSGCTSLTSIVIPSGVTSIGGGAFRSCTSLTSIVSSAATAPTIQSNTFRDVKTGGTLRVPRGSTGYNVWMGTGDYYLGKYNWTKVEQ